jgi:DNA-directed RNA polymerase specialized sigma24 family protein
MVEDSICLWMDIRSACDQLTARQQVALRLWLMGYTETEIGAEMGCAQQVAGRHIQAALRNLNQMLAE